MCFLAEISWHERSTDNAAALGSSSNISIAKPWASQFYETFPPGNCKSFTVSKQEHCQERLCRDSQLWKGGVCTLALSLQKISRVPQPCWAAIPYSIPWHITISRCLCLSSHLLLLFSHKIYVLWREASQEFTSQGSWGLRGLLWTSVGKCLLALSITFSMQCSLSLTHFCSLDLTIVFGTGDLQGSGILIGLCLCTNYSWDIPDIWNPGCSPACFHGELFFTGDFLSPVWQWPQPVTGLWNITHNELGFCSVLSIVLHADYRLSWTLTQSY